MRAGIRDSMMALLLCVLVCSLGRASSPQSCQQWQPPVPLGEVNSSGFNDKSPFLSFDGLTLYFSRENEPAGYFARLYQATRETPDGLFGDVREIIPLTDGGGHVSCPWVSADGLRMYYYSTSGLRRWLRMSQRGGLDEPWPPASYVSELNALGSLANPTLTEDERNVWGVEAYGQDLPSISNSIFWGNAESDLYGCQAKYSCIERSSDGQGNFSSDPLFVDAGSGDYHLLSARGRYWPEHDVWVLDEVTSPCVDAGDPAADFSSEPLPNGGRLNVGAHGGTAYAEFSEPPFTGDVNGDGAFDITDYDLFLDLWEQHTQPTPPPSPKRR